MSNEELIFNYLQFLQTERNIHLAKALQMSSAVEDFLSWCELEEIKIVAPE